MEWAELDRSIGQTYDGQSYSADLALDLLARLFPDREVQLHFLDGKVSLRTDWARWQVQVRVDLGGQATRIHAAHRSIAEERTEIGPATAADVARWTVETKTLLARRVCANCGEPVDGHTTSVGCSEPAPSLRPTELWPVAHSPRRPTSEVPPVLVAARATYQLEHNRSMWFGTVPCSMDIGDQYTVEFQVEVVAGRWLKGIPKHPVCPQCFTELVLVTGPVWTFQWEGR